MDAASEGHLSRQLYEAVARGQTRRFNELLDQGANPDRCWPGQQHGSTALHMAAQQGRTAFIHGLLRVGANVLATDALGRTAYDVFQQKQTLFGHFVFCKTAASYDCLVHLAYLTRFAARNEAEMARQASSQCPPHQEVQFEGIAVLHPGHEIDLGQPRD